MRSNFIRYGDRVLYAALKHARRFFPQHKVLGLLNFRPRPETSSLLDFLFPDPLGKTAVVVVVTRTTRISAFFVILDNKSPYSCCSHFRLEADYHYTNIFDHAATSYRLCFYFFPQHKVVGLLNFRPRPETSSLLDLLFSDPLGETAVIVIVVIVVVGPLGQQEYLYFC